MILRRNAEDDVEALRVANTMEDYGALVIAITPDGEATYPGAMAPHCRLVVWARIEDDAQQIARLDRAIANYR